MKTNTLALVLSVASLGGVGALYLKLDGLSKQMRMARADRTDRPASEADAAPARAPARTVPRRESGERTRPESAPASGDRLAGLPLEEQVARLRTTVARLEESEAARRERPSGWVPGRRVQMARTVDDLAERLALTPTQKARVRSAVERGRARVEDVLSIPGADGRSIKEIREESRRKMREAVANAERDPGGILTLAMAGHKRMGEKIPGRNETYRQEIDRIRKETRDEIDGALSADQKERFADTRIDPLLGDTGGTMSFTTRISSGGPDGGEESGAGILIAEEIAVEGDPGKDE